MKDLAFIMVLVMAGLVLVFLTMLQAASRTLKVALFLSLSMGLVCSFLVAMIAYEVDDTLEADAMYKIMMISQLCAGMTSIMLSMQPCFEPRNWQRSMAEGLQIFFEGLNGNQSLDKGMLHSIRLSDNSRTSGSLVANNNNNNSSNTSFGGINL